MNEGKWGQMGGIENKVTVFRKQILKLWDYYYIYYQKLINDALYPVRVVPVPIKYTNLSLLITFKNVHCSIKFDMVNT